MKHGIALIAVSFSLLACVTTAPAPSVVCPTMQFLSIEWQKAWAAEGRDAESKGLYPHLRQGGTYWATLRRQLKLVGCK